MKQALVGAVAGIALAAAGLAVAVYLGLLSPISLGTAATRPETGSTAEGDEHAGLDMGAMTGGGSETETTPAAEMAGMGVEADEPMAGTEGAAEMPPNSVMISPERQQLIGIRTTTVEHRALERTIRAVGLVEYDERRVAHIHTKVTGWIQSLQVDFTGERVDEGQELLKIYSPELLSTQEEYLLALRARGTLGNSSFDEVRRSAESLVEATRRRLQLWDITDEQIMAIEELGRPFEELPVFSPIRGFVIHKSAYEGQHVGPDTELYTIADLREVWITADIYEYELPLVQVGQRAHVTLPYFPGEAFEGVVDYIYPYMSGETRTAKARLVFSNEDGKLKPDMYANVELVAELGEGLVIPQDAVIDTGTRKVAFRVLPGGRFQPVEIETGFSVGDMLQVISGLEEGETIVSGAAFLVDSESKLGSAMMAMGMDMGHQ